MLQKVKYVPREILSRVAAHQEQPEITLITGSRQTGKTVLLSQLKQHLMENRGVSERQVFFFNLDLVQDQQSLSDQAAFIQFLRDRSQKERIFVFVDEAQKVPEAPRFFKGVYDSGLNVKLILTGSASLESKARFKETLAGRKIIFALSPFSFPEFVMARDEVLADMLAEKTEINPIDRASLLRLYKEYMRFGGYPRVALAQGDEQKELLLKEIYSSYVERDVIGFWNIQNPAAFNRLLKLLAAQIGQLVNISELATHIGADRQTVERHLSLLEETFIIKRVSPYFKNPRQEIVKAGKVYFLDTGIRNMALEDMKAVDERNDRGHLFENTVCMELERIKQKQGGNVHFWRTKQKTEVDFVFEYGAVLVPVEAKYAGVSGNIPRGLQSFIHAFNPSRALIATTETGDTSPRLLAHTKIQTVHPFMLEHVMRRDG